MPSAVQADLSAVMLSLLPPRASQLSPLPSAPWVVTWAKQEAVTQLIPAVLDPLQRAISLKRKEAPVDFVSRTGEEV